MKRLRSIFADLFSDKLFYKNLFKIALPIMVQNFITSFLNMIDTVMIGKVGEAEIAAVGIANQYFFFFVIITISICSGSGIFISQFWGKGDIKNIRKMLGVSLITGIISSVFFMGAAIIFPEKIIAVFNSDAAIVDLGARYLKIVIISYIFTAITLSYSFAFRFIGNTVIPMAVSSVALLCNIFFNYVFIFGNFGAPAMGVEGAALATLIARVVETVVLLGYTYSKGEVLAASLREMTDVTYEYVVRAFRTIVPVMLNEACWGLGSMVYSMAYGRIGYQAIASVQICNTILNLFMVVIFGMANAAAVMVGNRVGAGEEKVGLEYAARFSILGIMSGILTGLLLAATSPYMLVVFNVSQSVRHNSQMILYISSIVLLARVFNIIMIVGVFRGGGDAKSAFKIEAFTMWCIGVPLAFIGAIYLRLPVYYVAALLTAEEVVKAGLCLIRLRSGKWIKNVIHNMA